MKNITLSADERLIELVREEARARKTTLNALFREWLEEISRSNERRKKAEEVIQRETQCQFHESLIAAAALESGASILYSEGLQHDRRIVHLRIVNPFLTTP